MTEKPPEMRSWKTRLVTRLIHSYFAFARGLRAGHDNGRACRLF
jgi:hypothetical protein